MTIAVYPDRREMKDLLSRCTTGTEDIGRRAEEIVGAVKTGGDKALREIVEKIEGFVPDSFEVSEETIEEGIAGVSDEMKEAMNNAASNIRLFHEAQMRIEPVIVETMPGVRCEQRVLPIERVGFYIPGGRAPLFSTVLMLAIPARIAGCKEITMCTPLGKDGKIAPEILYAARLGGVDRIYGIGGAQAIAAMAYGTETIEKVNKIFGPGNRYVTRAKQIVAADSVAIDMPAGPSEVMVLADDSCNPIFAAADMLSQAEHGPDSQGIILCLSKDFAQTTADEVERLAAQLPRKEILAESLKNCRIIVLRNIDEMVEYANLYAAEHLIISLTDPKAIADRITAAGSIFIGAYSPESAGDYASGTNHTLPTSGWASSMNGINTDSFLKKITIQELTKEGLASLKKTITTMAHGEGLEAHALAVEVRLNQQAG
ncbi:MAG: histidinol dehydrogenase [Paramuribaculum sp.]|nr:histidinol dehydrogenase [Paramuribaculum sp.]